MCFHLSIISVASQIEEKTQKKFVNQKVKTSFNKPMYHLNGFTHPNLPIISQEISDNIIPAFWGIVPPSTSPFKIDEYYKKATKFGSGLNARYEKLQTHFLYKDIYKTQRCVILVNAFFEPHHVNNKSYPYLVKKRDGDLLWLAGIYTRFNNGLLTCTILTKPATPLLAEIHNAKQRQPVILSQDLSQEWLGNKLTDTDINHIITTNYNDGLLESYAVSKSLHKPNIDSNQPEILKPEYYTELNTLF